MAKRIAVEDGLASVGRYLEKNGYDVVQMNVDGPAGNYDAYVISGGDVNVMGMQDVTTDVPVINARGMTPEEVYEQVEERVGH